MNNYQLISEALKEITPRLKDMAEFTIRQADKKIELLKEKIKLLDREIGTVSSSEGIAEEIITAIKCEMKKSNDEINNLLQEKEAAEKVLVAYAKALKNETIKKPDEIEIKRDALV